MLPEFVKDVRANSPLAVTVKVLAALNSTAGATERQMLATKIKQEFLKPAIPRAAAVGVVATTGGASSTAGKRKAKSESTTAPAAKAAKSVNV